MITVSVWHNVAHDAEGRHTAMLDGYQPGHPMVRVFAYQADPGGRAPVAIAEEAFTNCNGHPRDAGGEELSRRYYARELRSLSVGDIVVVGEVPLAVGRFGWSLVRGGLNETRAGEHGTRPLPAPAAPGNPCPIPPRRSTAMSVLESRDYQAARDRLKSHPIVSMMAAGVVTVPLAELAHQDGTPRSRLMHQANHAFDDAEARNKANHAYQPYPPDAHRHLGLIAEAVLAERAAMREAVASAMAAPGTHPESDEVTAVIERLRAGESALQIARQTGAIAGPGPGPLPPPAPAESGGAASGEPEQGVI